MNQLDEDLLIVAQFVVASMAWAAEWSEWPEVGEHDWVAIQRHVAAIAPFPDMNTYHAAYERLEARANEEVDSG